MKNLKSSTFLRFIYIYTLSLFVGATATNAQINFTDVSINSSTEYSVALNDGAEFTGKYTAQTDTTQEILSENTQKKSDSWFQNPNATRYNFTQSAFSLGKGKVSYQNTWIILNNLQVGITDNLSIGGGVLVFPAFPFVTDESFNIYMFSAKYSFNPVKDIHLATGIQYFSTVGDAKDILLFSGVGTFGNRDNNVSLGIYSGYNDTRDGEDIKLRPIFTLSGMTRISKRFSFVADINSISATSTDEFDTESDQSMLTYFGLRMFGKKLAVDLGILSEKTTPQIPIIKAAINF